MASPEGLDRGALLAGPEKRSAKMAPLRKCREKAHGVSNRKINALLMETGISGLCRTSVEAAQRGIRRSAAQRLLPLYSTIYP
jgi:hypothetical protein